MRRDLAVTLRAPVTWLVAALAALLVGHGFVLAVDLFSAASRSALGHALMRREMDPLAGIVRPTLGGLFVAAALLLPVLAARGLAVEKERRTFAMRTLEAGGTSPLVRSAYLAALSASGLLLVPVLVLLAAIRALGGHVDLPETAVALLGHALHLAFIAAVSVAAAAWTRTVAQATALALSVSLASWAVDAGEDFAALAWVGGLEPFSIGRRLDAFERGLVHLGALGWFAVAIGGAFALAHVGARFERPRRKALLGAALAAGMLIVLWLAAHVHRAYDWSEERRASLPPAAVAGLRAFEGPIRVEVWFDRDDGRRKQLERDVLAKLRMARPDAAIVTPLDERGAQLGERDPAYGRVVLRAGGGVRETRSTSRREVTFLLFEAAGLPLPDWSQPAYPGYPWVAEGARRSMLLALAYALLPGLFLGMGWWMTRRKRR
jgi:hypothetical protein